MIHSHRRLHIKTTINGIQVNNVALNKAGIPQLGDSMNFITIGRSGSVKDRSKKKIGDNYGDNN